MPIPALHGLVAVSLQFSGVHRMLSWPFVRIRIAGNQVVVVSAGRNVDGGLIALPRFEVDESIKFRQAPIYPTVEERLRFRREFQTWGQTNPHHGLGGR